jgi:sensor histidine kinase YesM
MQVKSMIAFENNKLLFSDEKKYRIRRHLLFWGFWGFYFGMVRELNPTFLIQQGRFPDLIKNMAQAFLTLLPQALLVYPLLYFILPRYLFNGKYIKATFCITVLLLLVVLINATLIINIPWLRAIWLPQQYNLFATKSTFSGRLVVAYLAALQGALVGTLLAVSFKMFKYYYLKNLRNQQLQKENTAAQLQVLKAQVHPHFLFNTLNNIYSQTQLESPKGSKMIMGLSHILRYILYDGQKPLVPLKQELQMMTEYIHLEKIRYGNKLDVQMHIADKADDLYIAPLLLLPFVENCFKHGTSNILQNPWINLTVELKDITLVMKLMNGKASLKENSRGEGGIGINNVRQRLELLYTNKYDLQIREDDETFVIDLRIELIKIEDIELTNSVTKPKPDIVYG